MATLTLRTVKGSPLTNAEVDANFTNINNELATVQSNPTFTGDVVISGDLTVQGNTTTLSAQNLAISDNMLYMNQGVSVDVTNAVGDGTNVVYTTSENNYIIGMNVDVTGVSPSSFNVNNATITAVTSTSFTIASTNTDTFSSAGTARAHASTNPDLGWSGAYDDGSYGHAGIFRDASDGVFKVYDGYTLEPDESTYIDTTHSSFNLADFQATTFIGALNGNATTASALQTARSIALSGDLSGSASFDGSAGITINATINTNSVALGTDTTGFYVGTITGTTNEIEVAGSGSEGASVTIGLPNSVTISGTMNAADFNSTSDLRLKENINPLQNSLKVIESLEGVSFNWKENGKEAIGVIAQQVEEIIPQIVSTDDEGIKRVSYDSIVPLLIEAIKELNSKIS